MNDSWPPRSQFKAAAAATLLFWRKWAKQRQRRSSGKCHSTSGPSFEHLTGSVLSGKYYDHHHHGTTTIIHRVNSHNSLNN